MYLDPSPTNRAPVSSPPQGAPRRGRGTALFAASTVLLAALWVTLALLAPRQVAALPQFFSGSCASCHTNDTPTCNGCHHHRSTLTATPNHTQYYPGDPVTVTLNGGSQSGWIRALLYDQNNVEIDRRTGPTGTGDDGLGNPVTFPVALNGVAPDTPGTYTWNAAWFGNSNDGGPTHGENRRSFTLTVVSPPSDVQDQPYVLQHWGRIKARLFK